MSSAIPKFLHQLIQILTDESNHPIISWEHGYFSDDNEDSSEGRYYDKLIVVHNPDRLVEILSKYFRHSNYASFQRQMNYFGFKKIHSYSNSPSNSNSNSPASDISSSTYKKKGKMCSCAYVHELLKKNDEGDSSVYCLLKLKRRNPKDTAASRKIMRMNQKDKSNSNKKKSRIKYQSTNHHNHQQHHVQRSFMQTKTHQKTFGAVATTTTFNHRPFYDHSRHLTELSTPKLGKTDSSRLNMLSTVCTRLLYSSSSLSSS